MKTNMAKRSFWEERASDYFMPFDSDVFRRTYLSIDIMKKYGVKLRDSEILDVGSGTGIFALPMAAMGAKVTALDISANMLKRLKAEAAARKIHGVRTLRSSWKELSPKAIGFVRRFDAVISSLSPAVDTENDLLKMEQCSKDSCVCIAACDVRLDSGREKIFKRLGISFMTVPDMKSIRSMVEALGRKCFYEAVPVEKAENKNLSQMIDDIKKSLNDRELEFSESEIREAVLQSFPYLSENKTVRCFWQSSRGVLVWKTNVLQTP